MTEKDRQVETLLAQVEGDKVSHGNSMRNQDAISRIYAVCTMPSPTKKSAYEELHSTLSNSNRVILNFSNSNNIFRCLDSLLVKNLYNSNLCNSKFLQFEHFYDPPECSNRF